MESIAQQLAGNETMIDASGEQLSEADFTQLGLLLAQHGDSVLSLDLHESGLDDAAALVLADTALSQMTALHDLSVCWNEGLTSAGLLSLLQRAPPQLKDLYLAGNVQLGDLAVEHLATTSNLLGQLELLDLGECGLGLEACVILANHLAQTPRLRELSLGLNPGIGDDGLKALCNILPLTMLESLDVSGCGISDDGVTPLAIALNACPRLREVRLADNLLTDFGALVLGEALKQSVVVEVLELEGNAGVTPEMLDEVYKHLKRTAAVAAERQEEEEEEA